MSVTSNADSLAKLFRQRIAKLEDALRKGLRKWAISVDNEQVQRLKGGSAVGDYPLPVRSGNLLQGHFFKVQGYLLALVGNTASYALPIHDGSASYGVHGARPFLQDAADAVDGSEIMQAALRKVVFLS